MRRIPGYLTVAVCIVIYFISSSNKITRQLEAHKFRPGAVPGSDRYRYGDLYGMSYLSSFRNLDNEGAKEWTIDTNTARCIHLYAICDSYLWSFLDNKKFYRGVRSLTMAKTNNREKLHLEPGFSAPNILLIELSERNLRAVLSDTAYLNNLLTHSPDNTKKPVPPENKSLIHRTSKFFNSCMNFIAFRDINKNIESNAWDYSFFTPLKELKADLNYRLLGVIDKNVVLGKNQQQLYFSPTIDTSKLTSSFKYIPDTVINNMVENLNRLDADAQKIGFKKILLSIVPNPVSILEPGYGGLEYNQLVSRIQNAPQLRIPYIDLLPDFKRLKDSVYKKSDSHWNEKGIRIWLEKFNNELKKIETGKNRQ